MLISPAHSETRKQKTTLFCTQETNICQKATVQMEQGTCSIQHTHRAPAQLDERPQAVTVPGNSLTEFS